MGRLAEPRGRRVSRIPDGIAVSEAFASYLKEFRERYPLDTELAEKYGLPAGNGHFRNPMTQIRSSGGYGGSA